MAGNTLILDYGGARAGGLLAALQTVGAKAEVVSNAQDARLADVLVLPDAPDDDESLRRGVTKRMLDAVRQHVSKDKPLLAVGRGMLLLSPGFSSPSVSVPGAALFDAPTFRLESRLVDAEGRPLSSPHLGYTYVVGLDRHPALAAVVPAGDKGVWAYFRHRLCISARVPFADVAVAHHGLPFAGAIWRKKTLATQFLPELSGNVGLGVLSAWHKSVT